MSTTSGEEFRVSVEVEESQTTITVSGEIDVATAPTLEAYVEGVLAVDRGDVVMDVKDVGFMDSSGLGVLLRAERQLVERGCKLILRSPSPAVSRLLSVAGVEQRLRILP